MVKTQILYVLDDDAQYSQLLADVARDAGWSSIVNEQSPSAFLARDLSDGGVLVLDLDMPEIDGIEVIRALARRRVNLLLVLISGHEAKILHSAKQLAEAHQLTVIGCLSKPISISGFLALLKKSQAQSSHKPLRPSVSGVFTAEAIAKALACKELILHYQPQINLSTGALQGVEALVRWQHPECGLVFPDQFIALAEEHQLIDALTEEVIRMAVEQSQAWQVAGIDIVISINISANNITSLSLPEQLKELTDNHQIDPRKIVLEITESAVMGELTSSLDVLNRLRMKGFMLSIDDFGTGYSSLIQLYQAPFTEIKIDQRFISRMLEDREAMVIVEICITLGHMLSMTLVAEGVDSQEAFDQLGRLGCDIAQGNFLSKPLLADELLTWQSNRCSN